MAAPEKAKDFIKELKETYGQPAWIIGEVVKGSKQGILRKDHEIIEVDQFLL